MEKINGDGSVSESKLQLKVGNYYRRRDWKIVGPLCENQSSNTYVFASVSDDLTYNDSGYWSERCPNHPYDLIEDLGPVDPRSAVANITAESINKLERESAVYRDPLELEKAASARKALFDSLNESAKKELSPVKLEPAKPRKRPLQVGDRVRVYSDQYGVFVETIRRIDISGAIPLLFFDDDDSAYYPQQCKRLKPKKQKAKNVFSGKTDAEIAEQIKMSMRINGLCEPESLAGNAFLKHLGLGE